MLRYFKIFHPVPSLSSQERLAIGNERAVRNKSSFINYFYFVERFQVVLYIRKTVCNCKHLAIPGCEHSQIMAENIRLGLEAEAEEEFVSHSCDVKESTFLPPEYN